MFASNKDVCRSVLWASCLDRMCKKVSCKTLVTLFQFHELKGSSGI